MRGLEQGQGGVRRIQRVDCALEMGVHRRAAFCVCSEEHKIAVTARDICHLNKLTKWKNKRESYRSAFLFGMKVFEEKS